jgi:hypothetical protein
MYVASSSIAPCMGTALQCQDCQDLQRHVWHLGDGSVQRSDEARHDLADRDNPWLRGTHAATVGRRTVVPEGRRSRLSGLMLRPRRRGHGREAQVLAWQWAQANSAGELRQRRLALRQGHWPRAWPTRAGPHH